MDAAVRFYGGLSDFQISEAACATKPWIKTRKTAPAEFPDASPLIPDRVLRDI
jgi:hypothetical protein